MNICLKCRRNEYEVLLLKLPFESIYEDKNLVFLGNVREDEFMCLPCIGYQFDEVFEKETEKKLAKAFDEAKDYLWQYYGIEPRKRA